MTLTDAEPCDHDWPERDGRCVSCWAGISGDAKLMDELREQKAALVTALKRYGKHKDLCLWEPRKNTPPCTCGLNDALGGDA